MKRVAGAILVGLAVAGCGGEAERRGEVSPYVVQVDLAPQIQSFGEETATADEAGEQLAAMGTAAIPALATALGREPAKDVRLKAIEVLRAIGTPDAVPPLLSAAGTDADEDVRADALRALGAIGDGRALALMEKALADQHLPIRAGGVMGCATLCTSPAAIERLADIAVYDENTAVALSARTTLAALRAKGAAEDQAVRAAIEHIAPAVMPAGAAPDQRALAALLATDVHGAAAIPALVASVAAASPLLQRHVAWRCGAIGDERCTEALRQLLAASEATTAGLPPTSRARIHPPARVARRSASGPPRVRTGRGSAPNDRDPGP